jgi:hypothetical protein
LPAACSAEITWVESPSVPPNTVVTPALLAGWRLSAMYSRNATSGVPATVKVEVESKLRVLRGMVWK